VLAFSFKDLRLLWCERWRPRLFFRHAPYPCPPLDRHTPRCRVLFFFAREHARFFFSSWFPIFFLCKVFSFFLFPGRSQRAPRSCPDSFLRRPHHPLPLINMYLTNRGTPSNVTSVLPPPRRFFSPYDSFLNVRSAPLDPPRCPFIIYVGPKNEVTGVWYQTVE